MTHRYIKLAATSVVLVLAFSGLLWSTLRDGTEYYKNVDEIVGKPEVWQDKKLQLHGYVVPGSILTTRDRLEYKFKVQHTPAERSTRFRVLFLARPADDTPPRATPNEHSLEARWVTLDELDALPLRGPEVRAIFRWVANGAPVAPMGLLGSEA